MNKYKMLCINMTQMNLEYTQILGGPELGFAAVLQTDLTQSLVHLFVAQANIKSVDLVLH